MLTLDELRADVDGGSIDTVVVAFTDMQGRLLGKRVHARYFVDEGIAELGVEGCNYLLALDVEMDPIPGYSIASWEQGYGDFGIKPDLATLRRIPWLEATALVLCDVVWHDGSAVKPSPRHVLQAQVERARSLGYEPMIGSELEFYSGRRREPVSRVRGVDRRGSLRDRARTGAAAAAAGERLRVGCRALPLHLARGHRRARPGNDGAGGAGRRGRRPLPQLRAGRAAAVRRGRHLLRTDR